MPLSDPGPAGLEQVAARFRGLLADARRRGCIDPRLSDGEQQIIAALLDPAGPSTDACAAIATALWGLSGAEADAGAGYPRTWAFLRDLARC